MTVLRRGDRWHYDFQVAGQRYTSPIGMDSREDAEEAQAIKRRAVRRRAAGLEALDARDTPTFTDWAGITLKWLRTRKQIKRPDEAKNTLRMILAFWGKEPREKPVEDGRYLNLRLGDPIQRPELVEQFEQWMTKRGISGARKNHYRSACSMLYRVALLPHNRRVSGVRENPFAGVMRDRVPRRRAILTPEQLVDWITSAPLPVTIAVTIGALAPALRFENVAELRRRQINADKTLLTIDSHKTEQATGAPLVVSISPDLREVIEAVVAQWPKDPYVVPLVGERYWQLQKLIKASIKAAGLPYGRKGNNIVGNSTARAARDTWRPGISCIPLWHRWEPSDDSASMCLDAASTDGSSRHRRP